MNSKDTSSMISPASLHAPCAGITAPVSVKHLMHPVRLPRYERFDVNSLSISSGSETRAARSASAGKNSVVLATEAMRSQAQKRDADTKRQRENETSLHHEEVKDFGRRLRHLRREQARQYRERKYKDKRRQQKQQQRLIQQERQGIQLTLLGTCSTADDCMTLCEYSNDDNDSCGGEGPLGVVQANSQKVRSRRGSSTMLSDDSISSLSIHSALSGSDGDNDRECGDSMQAGASHFSGGGLSSTSRGSTSSHTLPRLSLGLHRRQELRLLTDVNGTPQLEKDFSLIQCMFMECLISQSWLVAELRRLGEAFVVRRVREIATTHFRTAMDKEDLFFLLSSLLGKDRVPSAESDHLFRFLDWRNAGRVGLSDLPNSIALIFYPTEALILMHFRRMLTSRGLTTAMLSMMEVRLILAAMESVLGNRCQGLSTIIDDLTEELRACTNVNRQVPLNIMRSILGRQNDLLELLTNYLPWAETVSRELPSPDPEREVAMLYERFVELRQRTASLTALASSSALPEQTKPEQTKPDSMQRRDTANPSDLKAVEASATITSSPANPGNAISSTADVSCSNLDVNVSGSSTHLAASVLAPTGSNEKLEEASQFPSFLTSTLNALDSTSAPLRHRPPSPWRFGTYSTAVYRYAKMQQLKEHQQQQQKQQQQQSTETDKRAFLPPLARGSSLGDKATGNLGKKSASVRHGSVASSEATAMGDQTATAPRLSKVFGSLMANSVRSGNNGIVGSSRRSKLVSGTVSPSGPSINSPSSPIQKQHRGSGIWEQSADREQKRQSLVSLSSSSGKHIAANDLSKEQDSDTRMLMWSNSSLADSDPTTVRMVADRFMRSRLDASEQLGNVRAAMEWMYTRLPPGPDG